MLFHTRTIWYVVAISGPSVCGCGTKIAQTTYQPAADHPGSDAGESPMRPPTCGPTLKERLTVTSIPVDEDIRYKRAGYHGFPSDERIAMDVQPSGASQVAWLDNGLSSVHVTPLTADETRAAPDTVIEGFDIGGLVAHEDGFAVLTRRNDPGDPIGDIPDAGPVAPAAFLVRVRNNREVFADPLTGTRNITDDGDASRRDCSTGLFGRLAFNGYFYGSYFAVRGCKGDWADGRYGDKLVYADTRGQFLRGGWTWRCSQNLGLRLLPERNAFTSLCMSDNEPQPGLNLVVGGLASKLIAREATLPGYAGGDFGSVVKVADGRYLLGWVTRGVRVNAAGAIEAGMDTHDIAYTFISSNYVPSAKASWLFRTPDVHEINLHLAPYGADRILLVWNTITSPQCSDGLCLGAYGGTHFRLMYLDGTFVGPEEVIDAPPNDGDDIVVFPNGDLGWAYVGGPRDYSAVLVNPSSAPPMRQISVAKLMYCSN